MRDTPGCPRFWDRRTGVAVLTPGEGSSGRPDEEHGPEAASTRGHWPRRTCRVRSSSWLLQVSCGSGFWSSLWTAPAHGWLGLVSAPVRCGSSSPAASGMGGRTDGRRDPCGVRSPKKKPSCLRCRLPCARPRSWLGTVPPAPARRCCPDRAAPGPASRTATAAAHGWLGPVSAAVHCHSSSRPRCSYGQLRLISAPLHVAPAYSRFIGKKNKPQCVSDSSLDSSPLLPVPVVLHLQLVSSSSSILAPAHSSLCLLKCSWLFAKVINQSLSEVLYEYELS
ncbi:uncharacterized protein LOC135313208 [Phalacrocorax carbo]|uniref:uncharacterized protein LOC135313208 n=1 Tax=Phalacrocorax carbo TaxID=9209 RepID=UPI0031193CB6